jgi:hypothetical protein
VPGVLGPRFLIEAGFIIAVAVVAGVERFRTVTIVIVIAAALLVVAAVELVFAWKRRAAAQPEQTTPGEPSPSASEEDVPRSPVRVLRAEESLSDSTPLPPEPEPEPLPEEAPPPEPLRPIPQRPRIAAVPPPAAEPETIPPPTPEPAAAVVPLSRRRSEPREWNIWELERLVRAHSGADVVRDEERSYLLMYLREFASPEGHLPADFDGVVRETFGDELDAIPY